MPLSGLKFFFIAVLDTGMTGRQFFSFKKTSKVLDESPEGGGIMDVAEFLSGIHFKE